MSSGYEVQREIKEYEIDMGKPMTQPSAQPETVHLKIALERAIFKRDFAKIMRIVKGGANLNEPGPNGLTPLMMAVGNGDLELVHYLVEKGANVNAKGVNGSAALSIAIAKGNRQMVIELISLEADVNQVNDDDEPPLVDALDSNVSKEAILGIVDVLLMCGADPHQKSEKTGETPLLLAEINNRIEIANLLKKRDAEKSAIETRGNVRAKRQKGKWEMGDFSN